MKIKELKRELLAGRIGLKAGLRRFKETRQFPLRYQQWEHGGILKSRKYK